MNTTHQILKPPKRARGRPKKPPEEKGVRLHVVIEPDLMAEIEAYAEAHDLTVSQATRVMLWSTVTYFPAGATKSAQSNPYFTETPGTAKTEVDDTG